jgi:hypothetical protein
MIPSTSVQLDFFQRAVVDLSGAYTAIALAVFQHSTKRVGQSEGCQGASMLTSANFAITTMAITRLYIMEARPLMRTWCGVVALPANPSAPISPSRYSCTCGAKNACSSLWLVRF